MLALITKFLDLLRNRAVVLIELCFHVFALEFTLIGLLLDVLPLEIYFYIM